MRSLVSSTMLTVLLLGACGEPPDPPPLQEAEPLPLAAGQESSSARLSRSAAGTIVLAWLQQTDGETSVRYSQFVEEKWAEPATAYSSELVFVNWADLPSVRRLNDGSLLAHWLESSPEDYHAYGVLLSHSSDGEKWSEPVSPHTDGTASEHGFVSFFESADDLGLIWLDGRKTINEVTDNPVPSAMTIHSTTLDDNLAPVPESEIDDMVCDCCQTDIAMTDAGAVAVYRDRTADEVRDIYVSRRLDGAWSPGVPVATDNWVIEGCPVNGPAIDALGQLVVVAWFTGADNKSLVQAAVSTDGGLTFGEPVSITSGKTMGRVDVSFVADDSFVVSWLATGKAELSDVRAQAITVEGIKGPAQTVGRTSVAYTVPQMALANSELVFAWTDEINNAYRVVSVRVPVGALGEY